MRIGVVLAARTLIHEGLLDHRDEVEDLTWYDREESDGEPFDDDHYYYFDEFDRLANLDEEPFDDSDDLPSYSHYEYDEYTERMDALFGSDDLQGVACDCMECREG